MKTVRETVCLVTLCTLVWSLPHDALAETHCEQVKREAGFLAYTKCVSREMKDAATSYGKNYIPGPGGAPGMAMDEIKKKADEISDFCHGEGSPCDGQEPGTTVGKCKC